MKIFEKTSIDRIITKSRIKNHNREILASGKSPSKCLNIKEQIIVPAKIMSIMNKSIHSYARVINTHIKKVY